MIFVLNILSTTREHDSIFFVVEIFSKMAHFIPSKNTSNLVHVVELFFKETVKFHGLPRSIVSNRDNKIFGYFYKTLWKKLDIELNFGSIFHQ